MFPSVARCLNMWLVSRLKQLKHRAFPDPARDWRWSSITINRGYAAARHVDANNHGPSIIRSLAESTDRLLYWPEGDRKSMASLDVEEADELPVASSKRMYAFDGRCPHEVKAYQGDVGNRLSIVFFLSARGWNADASTLRRLADLGFVPAADAEDAQAFEERFNILTRGMSCTSWRLQ